ncbi:hypothetical protein MTO96_011967 [Rhipicephalus appendiculatus]
MDASSTLSSLFTAWHVTEPSDESSFRSLPADSPNRARSRQSCSIPSMQCHAAAMAVHRNALPASAYVAIVVFLNLFSG